MSIRPETSAPARRPATNHLLGRERLGRGRGQPHDLDAEAGIDRLDLVAQQPGQPLDVADRLGGADADRLDPVVDQAEQQIEAPGAEASQLQFLGRASTVSLAM